MNKLFLRLSYFIFICTLLTGCLGKGHSNRHDLQQKEPVDTRERIAMLERWKKAVVHLEGASDSEHIYDFIKRLERLRQQLEKKEISWEQFIQESSQHNRDIRHHGTALFVTHKGKRYLVTARHVLFDEASAKRELQEEINRIGSWPQDRHKDMILSAQERLSDRIFNIIFRVPSLDEFLAAKPDSHREFLMNLGAGGPNAYTFSRPDYDLAVIGLDQRNARFAEELIKVGYVPIESDLIGDESSTEGSDVFTVGYPSSTALLGQVNLPPGTVNWTSPYFSLPVFAFGKVSMINRNLPFFWSDMSIYPGNSGGPVIQEGKLIGVVSAQATVPIDDFPNIRTRIPFAKIIEAKYVSQLLEIQAEKDQHWLRK